MALYSHVLPLRGVPAQRKSGISRFHDKAHSMEGVMGSEPAFKRPAHHLDRVIMRRLMIEARSMVASVATHFMMQQRVDGAG